MTLLEQRPIEIDDLPAESPQHSSLTLAAASLANHLQSAGFEAHLKDFRNKLKENADTSRPQKLYSRIGGLLIRDSDLVQVSSGEIFRPAYQS